MRKVVIIPLLCLFLAAAFAQKPNTKASPAKPVAAKPTPPKSKPAAKPTPKPKVRDSEIEKAEFDKIAAITDPAEKLEALQRYEVDFPKSDKLAEVVEMIVVSRAVIAAQKLEAHETEAGIALFKLAIKEAPTPIPDKLFDAVMINFPTNLFYQGQRVAAVEVAALIEEKAGNNAKQLLNLAAFYLGIEQSGEAKRIAEKVIANQPDMPDAYQTLGLAQRMSFQSAESAAAYAKALELKPDSVISKRSLAEMKRSLGKTEEAAALYRELLALNPDDPDARTGLILCLFDLEKKEDAESEMARALELNPGNLPLLAGAAYWYAAHNQGEKAVEIAQKAIEIEPRYIWSHIALARGFMDQNKPLDAERVLLSARQYGNFPTLEYEIASARLIAGFYRDAVEELEKSFAVKDGMVNARLGGRVPKETKSFIELISFERRASIFEPLAADNPENAGRLKALLDLTQLLGAKDASEAEIIAAADAFIEGDDRMKFHRQLYVASILLQKRRALPKVLELMKAAALKSDSAADGPNVTSAILADQLYESRVISIARNQLVLVPEVPRQMLSAIVRGKIEDMTGWALFQQSDRAGALIHLRRAVSVMPDKSAWWRASVWKLGAVLEADGKDAEALDNYIKSYVTDRPSGIKYLTIASLYRKVHGNIDGLEAKIGVNPDAGTAAENTGPAPVPSPSTDVPSAVPVAETTPAPEPKTTPEIRPTPSSDPVAAGAQEETTPKTSSTPEAEPEPTPGPPPKVEATPETSPAGETFPTPSPEPSPDIAPADKPDNVKSDPEKPANSPDKPKQRDLFDPVVITVPSAGPSKSRNLPPNPPAEGEGKKTDSSGAERPRVVGEKTKPGPEAPRCAITFSQENIALANNGGSIGLLVGIDGEGNAEDLQATSSSPGDVAVAYDPATGSSRKAFFVIKSISKKMGLFTVTFEGACGKKEITVKVN